MTENDANNQKKTKRDRYEPDYDLLGKHCDAAYSEKENQNS